MINDCFWLSDEQFATLTRGIWQRLFEKIAGSGPVPDELSIDSTHVKAHRSAAGSKRGSGTKRSAARVAGGHVRFTAWPMIVADRSPLP